MSAPRMLCENNPCFQDGFIHNTGLISLVGSWGPQPGAPVSVASVWDIDPPKSQTQSLEEIQMMEMERQRREADEREREREREIQVGGIGLMSK